MQASPDAKKVIISVNPKAGRTSPMLRAEELRDRLRDMRFEAELTTDLAEVTEKAERYFKNGELRTLVGVGGDGTAAELVNRTSPGVPVTLLSSGTANLIAKYLRLGKTPQILAEQINAGHLISFDAGLASGRLFLVMVSCGLDAEVVRQVHAHREARFRSGSKKGAHISYLTYIKPIFRTICTYNFPEIKVEVLEGGDETAYNQSKRDKNLSKTSDATSTSYTLNHGRWAFVFNLPCYGWGLPLVPKAIGTDAKLDHCLFDGPHFWHGFKYTAFAQCGSMHRHLSDVRLGQAKKYRLTSEGDVPYQLDGDPGGMLPVEIEVLEKRFTALVSEWAARKYS